MEARLPKVSIVTPSFNQASFLEQTIRSVLEQGYPNLEYLIFDGGSTDDSVDIIRSYSEQLTYWTSEPDGGQADAVNKGWARATGDVVAFLNSDDFYLPGALHAVGNAFCSNPGAGIIYGQGLYVTKKGQPLKKVGGQISAQTMIDNGHYSLPQPAVFVTRCVVDSVGMLDTRFHYALDGEFFTRAFANFDAVYLPIPLACLRIHTDSKSVGNGTGFVSEILRAAEKVAENASAYPRCNVERSRVLSGAYVNSGRFLYNNGLFLAATANFVRAIRLSRKHTRQIVFREMPRLLLRLALGRSIYAQVSRYVHG